MARDRRPTSGPAASAGDRPRSRRKPAPIGDSYERALDLAWAQLAARPRSQVEIRRRLARAEAAPEVIDRVVARLIELRYLDDEAFARGRAQALARRGFGPRAVAFRLAQAGVAEGDRRAGVEEVDADEEALALQALERRLRGRAFGDLDAREQLRLRRWLASRGFSSTAVRSACQRSFDPDRDGV